MRGARVWRPLLTSPAERSALLWSGGMLRRLPTGLVLGVPTDLDALRASGIVSSAAVDRAACDLEATAPPEGEPAGDPVGAGDMSVGQLIRGRLGDEVHERLVSPLLSGVNAGDADHLSAAVGAAQLASAARRSPSLIEGVRAQRREALDARTDPDAPIFHGIPVGTQTLTDLLMARITMAGAAVHLGSEVDLHPPDPEGLLGADATRSDRGRPRRAGHPCGRDCPPPRRPRPGRSPADSPSWSTRRSPWSRSPCPATRSGVPIDASGFLVSEADRLPALTACSWASRKWAHLADPDVVILRASVGRHGDAAALELADQELVDAVVDDLRTTMGLTAAPTEHRVTRWWDALPQFRPGHLARVEAWRDEVGRLRPRRRPRGRGLRRPGHPGVHPSGPAGREERCRRRLTMPDQACSS